MQKNSCSTTNQSIYTSRKMLLELLEQQGYNIDEYKNISVNEIHVMTQNKQLDLFLEKDNKKVFIKYHLAKSLRVTDIEEMIEDLFVNEDILNKTDDLIIVVKDNPNDSINTAVKYLWDTNKYFVTLFNIKALQFNVLKHSYVPKHTILSKEEEDAMKKIYNVSDNNELPEISRFDPVAKAIGLRPNQVCKIIRRSKTAIVKDFYRICI